MSVWKDFELNWGLECDVQMSSAAFEATAPLAYMEQHVDWFSEQPIHLFATELFKLKKKL